MAGPVWAQGYVYFQSGNTLYDTCTGNLGGRAGACFGYVTGVIDGITNAHVRRGSKIPFCIPAGVTKRQVADVVVVFLAANPAERNIDGAHLVRVALIRAFPC
ncbi:Rap1a/Tai family immunity protein [Sulfitobacter geojensis]|uniref:Rap1a/Tai family immunity protein n=1 Tax=Sulfitobacter geojensis TaxID=1342299 RepID=UPI003BABD8F4